MNTTSRNEFEPRAITARRSLGCIRRAYWPHRRAHYSRWVPATVSENPVGARAPDRRRYLILAICCMSLFIVGLDNTIVNVGLPSIRRELRASIPQLQWST